MRSFDPRPQTEMHAFWLRLSEERRSREGIAIPSFADFRLLDLPSHLIRGTVLIDLGSARARSGEEGRPYFRFAGETHYNILGFECTRHFLDELPLGFDLAFWRNILAHVASQKAPVAGEHAFRDAAERDLLIHWLRLPLSLDGRVVDMVLGHDIYSGTGGLPE
ncbi:MAG: hypothetical protein K9H25_00245 [Rhodospirillum sp.]|nr:hypothetical protein [Rhodospirillum sp.]MCF8488177.1 hypothetical protein [Rhodospirillum sp.]MCF8501934.1 hypothetical protein [Rhodospirillum sp.]